MTKTNHLGYPEYILHSIPYADLDFDKWWDLWNRSQTKPFNCYPPFMCLYYPYWRNVTKGRLFVLIAEDSEGNWVGGFPFRFDTSWKNIVFWEHSPEDMVLVENMELPEAGVLCIDNKLEWLLGTDVCLNNIGGNIGGLGGLRTSNKAQHSLVADVYACINNTSYPVLVTNWRELVTNKFRKQIDGTLCKVPYMASMFDGTDGFSSLDWLATFYEKKWATRTAALYRKNDLKNLINVAKAALIDGYGIVSDMTIGGCRSVEFGMYIDSNKTYHVPLVATELATKYSIGAIHMAWTMDRLNDSFGSVIYEQGTGDDNPLKMRWKSPTVNTYKLMYADDCPELRVPYERFIWNPKKTKIEKETRKPRNYRVISDLTTGHKRERLLGGKAITSQQGR